ncbi:hypothetical protein BGZ73_002115 [Actinomortierella ambigua]|nr:hypothetical protein BGZ73_002115 [Actinomortierella ambigua]
MTKTACVPTSWIQITVTGTRPSASRALATSSKGTEFCLVYHRPLNYQHFDQRAVSSGYSDHPCSAISVQKQKQQSSPARWWSSLHIGKQLLVRGYLDIIGKPNYDGEDSFRLVLTVTAAMDLSDHDKDGRDEGYVDGSDAQSSSDSDMERCQEGAEWDEGDEVEGEVGAVGRRGGEEEQEDDGDSDESEDSDTSSTASSEEEMADIEPSTEADATMDNNNDGNDHKQVKQEDKDNQANKLNTTPATTNFVVGSPPQMTPPFSTASSGGSPNYRKRVFDESDNDSDYPADSGESDDDTQWTQQRSASFAARLPKRARRLHALPAKSSRALDPASGSSGSFTNIPI